MFMVASSVVSTILILNYHHRNADTHEMSEWVSLCFCFFFSQSKKKKLLNKSPFCSLVIHFPSKQKKTFRKNFKFRKNKKNYLNFHNIISQSDSQQSINQSVSHSFIIKSIKTKFSYISSLSKNTRKQHQSISSFFYH